MMTKLPTLAKRATHCYSSFYWHMMTTCLIFLFTSFASAQSGAPDLIKVCEVTAFSDASNGHALWVKDIPGIVNDRYDFSPGAPGTFEFFSDGTARLKGRVVNKSDASLAWDIDFNFSGGSDWTAWSSAGGDYKDEANVVGSNYLDWDYFIFDSSKNNVLTGVDGLTGSSLTVTHRPADFEFGLQIGTAANSKNVQEGASTWFFYDGLVLGNTVSGIGDVNVNTTCHEVVSICPLEQYQANNHILWLPGLAAEADWIPAPFGVYFAELPNGKARLYGEIQNQNDPSLVLCIDFWFAEKADFATWSGLGRGIKGNPSNINGNEVNWDFYIFDQSRASTLTGCSASTLGSYVEITHRPADFNLGLQCGIGANDKNAEFGLSVWFFKNGTFQGNSVTGIGDVNSIKLCPPPPNIICFDNPPVITCPADTSIDCTSATTPDLLGEATADRPNTDCPLDVAIFFEDNMSVNGCVTTITRTWTVVDEYDNVVSCDQIITVVDNTPPNLDMPADLDADITCSDISLEEAEGFANGTLTQPERQAFLQSARALFISNGLVPLGTTDDCNDSDWIEVSIEVTLSDSCDGLAQLICTFVAEDDCGNTSDEIASFLNIVDNTAPVITCPSDVTVDCDGDSSPAGTGTATATDDCGGDVDISYVDGPTTGDCTQAFTRTWTATDACGNSSSCDQVITLIDTVAPVVPAAPANVTASCDESLPAAPELTAEDACQGTIVGVLSETTLPGSCANNFTV
ncbi:MAG: hypothetical protein MK086_03680, partial [Flavobacteriales bacterium]|nr:hypothetical protein [Flavobacteriales bacterium]